VAQNQNPEAGFLIAKTFWCDEGDVVQLSLGDVYSSEQEKWSRSNQIPFPL